MLRKRNSDSRLSLILSAFVYRFWTSVVEVSAPTSRRQLFRACADYLKFVIEEAEDRGSNTIRTVSDYFETRRENVGARMSYMINILGLDIPDEALYHPAIVDLQCYVTDMLIIDNVSL